MSWEAVMRFTNQERTVAEPLETWRKARREITRTTPTE
jgi:hypothetical protein